MKQTPEVPGSREAEMFNRLPRDLQIILNYLLDEAHQWLPKSGLWRPLVVAAFALQMAACKPTVGLEPTPTPTLTPTPTPTPTLEPTPTLTPTPTPIPTLSPERVGGVEGIPDPKETNPELFNLTRSDAPIPQFVRAMEMGGIEVDPQEVVDNLQYQPIKGVDGKEYIIGTYNLDPNPKKSGETLEGPITLMIAKKNENNEYEWVPYTHGELASIAGVLIGVSDSILPGSQTSPTLREFNQIVLADALWRIPYGEKYSLFPQEGVINPKPLISAVNNVKRRYPENSIMVHHLVWGNNYALPDWVIKGNYSKQQLEQFITDYIVKIMTPLKGKVNSWVVVNEAFPSNWSWVDRSNFFWHDRLGPSTQWIKTAFRTAHQTDSSATLILNDYGIEISDNLLYDPIKADQVYRVAKELHQEGIPIAVGFQMHYNLQYQPISDRLLENFKKTIKRYQNAGVEVKITEFDIRIDGVRGTTEKRLRLQAEAYYELLRAALEEGVRDINFFGIDDSLSWLKDFNAEATLKDRLHHPKPSFFSVNQALTSYLLDKKLK